MVVNKKILGNSFKQYKYLSANTFIEGKNNIISDKNIEELINNFNKRQVEVFIYHGHKADQTDERKPIGKILTVYKNNGGTGLDAVLDLYDDAKNYFDGSYYPSIEMVGKRINETDNDISWQDCELKALAFVEYPASKSVDLLCASGVIEEEIIQNEGGNNMNEKLNELIARIRTGDADARKEFIDLIKSDEELATAVIEVLAENTNTNTQSNEGEKTSSDTKVEENEDGSKKTVETEKTTNSEGGGEVKKEEEKKEETQLSAIEYNQWCNEYAESLGGIRCSAKSESDTYLKAKKLFKAGFKKEEIIDMIKDGLQAIGIKEAETVKMSGIKDKDMSYEEVSKMFKE